MKKNTKITAGLTAGAATLLAAGAIAITTTNASSAAETPAPTASPSASAGTTSPKSAQPKASKPAETPLTGADAEKATAAAKAAVAGGTVLRVETDSDGTYEAHVRKADGTEVVVKMDEDFKVTGVEEFTGRSGGRGGRNQTALTGANAEKATAAAKAAVPGGTVLRVEGDSDGTFHAHVRKADGTEVKVNMDKDFKVTGVEEFTGRSGGKGGQRGTGSASPTASPSATA